MNISEYIAAVKKLGLPNEEFIVIGSGVLVALGIREANDVDLVVSVKVFRKLERSGDWTQVTSDDGTKFLTNDIYEIGLDWHSKAGEPNLDDLKKSEVIIEGLPFVSMARLRAWKVWKSNDKAHRDIKLIDEYMEKQIP